MTRRIVYLALSVVLHVSSSATAQSPAEFPGLGPRGNLLTLGFDAKSDLALRGQTARAQLVVAGNYSSGQTHDVTHQAKYDVSPAGILKVDATGFVTPLADGTATVTATLGGKSTTIECIVAECSEPLPINYPNEIVPVLTKMGCNAGGCHGKSGGQNGFKLSLLGFYPEEDYEWLVKEHRGRRVFPAAPEFSLLLTKPLNKVPHGGGRRMEEDSYEYELLVQWIEQGMPYGSEDDPVVERVEVFPNRRVMNRDGKQQLRVVAHYSDGSTRDVTRLASFESNDPEMAETDKEGRVTVFDRPGDVAVMVRFQGQVGVFRASIPLGIPVTNLPPERNFIDKHVFAKLKQLGIPPSELCDDPTFVRRVYLDITGRLPTAEQAREFIASNDANKRSKLIDYLLETPGYGELFANKWAMVLRNQRIQNNTEVSFRFHDWIRRAIQQNMPYDQFVREILASEGDVETTPTASWYTQVTTPGSQAEDVAQLFLGLRVQCARCHHHPFEKWSQNDYYSLQAFFSRVEARDSSSGLQRGYIYHDQGDAKARNPRTNKDLVPAGLGGEPLELAPYEDPRHALVDWMSAPDNPFFARALTNRYWKHFFGRGIVDPEDDMRATNPPSNPDLLDGLAQHFIASKFDLKDLVRTICNSNTYQLSSEPNEFNQHDKQNFSSFYPRRLNAEPLYDAINQVAGTTVNFAGMPSGTRAIQLPDNGFDDYFLTVFGQPQAESACECERSAEANLAQSLHLLNSTDIQSKLTNGQGRAARLAAKEEMSDAQKIDEIFLAAFARPPREKEVEFVMNYLETKVNKRQAFEDILWAMFNTKEFMFNR